MTSNTTETLAQNGYPLVFPTRRSESASPALGGAGTDVFRVEARQLAGHQKEAIVTQGTGSAWRLVSDEGSTLQGTDLAPFPLGFFNAGVQADVGRRLRQEAERQGVVLDAVRVQLVNAYGFTGSFILGTGEGQAAAPEFEFSIASTASLEQLRSLVQAALQASPAIALLRVAMAGNPFALYINGRRRRVGGVAECTGDDAVDPYRVHGTAPRPLEQAVADLVTKLPPGTFRPNPSASARPKAQLAWNVFGQGMLHSDGMYETDTWLDLPNSSHFRICTDESGADRGPSGLALVSAAIAFCYMTQLSRYIDGMKMNIGHVRLVQTNAWHAASTSRAGPIETHLFLNGEAPEETHQRLLTIAARTCYLHAAARSALEPLVKVTKEPVAEHESAPQRSA